MPSLNERLRALEEMHPEKSVVDMLEPEHVADVLREAIINMERDVALGRGDEMYGSGPDARTTSETLPVFRESLAAWEREHGLAH
jgi:hypothetical protein